MNKKNFLLFFGFINFLFFLLKITKHKQNEQIKAEIPSISKTKSTLSGILKQIEWVDKQYVLGLTTREFYISRDSGKTWYFQNRHFCNADSCSEKLLLSPANKKTIFLMGTPQESSWIVDDITQPDSPQKYRKITFFNEKYKKITQFVDFQFHPTMNSRAFAIIKIESVNYLFVTHDLGKKWTLVLKDVFECSWGSNKQKEFNPDLIYGIKKFGQTKSMFSVSIYNSFTKEIIFNAEQFFHYKGFLLIATENHKNGERKLHISKDNGETISDIQFPVKELNNRNFTILESSLGSIFINVFHNVHSMKEPWGNVYLSDSTGTRFSLSLYHNRRSGVYCDFHKINSLEGVYIANVVNNLSQKQCSQCSGEKDCNEKCSFQSRITFDKGSMWGPISAPLIDSKSKNINCDDEDKLNNKHCPLQIHGFTSIVAPPILSHKSAVGLIVATGNVGNKLTDAPLNTYISRDAGVSWEEIFKGSYIPELIDHGGLIVMVEKSISPKFEFVYSWNQGKEWINEKIFQDGDKEKDIVIKHIFTNSDIDPTTKTAILHGVKDGKSTLIHLDFAKLHKRVCKEPGLPGSKSSDFEYFTPHTYKNKECFLGRTVKYVRRKRDSKCFTNELLEKRIDVKNCKCVREDYECDFGYTPNYSDRGELYCVRKKDTNRYQNPGFCFSTYNESQGYLKIAGDSCYGGLDLNPIIRHCPAGIGTIGLLILLTFIFIVVLLVIIIICFNSVTWKSIKSKSYKVLNQKDGVFHFDDEEEPDEYDEEDDSTNNQSEELNDDDDNTEIDILDQEDSKNNNDDEDDSFKKIKNEGGKILNTIGEVGGKITSQVKSNISKGIEQIKDIIEDDDEDESDDDVNFNPRGVGNGEIK